MVTVLFVEMASAADASANSALLFVQETVLSRPGKLSEKALDLWCWKAPPLRRAYGDGSHRECDTCNHFVNNAGHGETAAAS